MDSLAFSDVSIILHYLFFFFLHWEKRGCVIAEYPYNNTTTKLREVRPRASIDQLTNYLAGQISPVKKKS